MSSISNQNRYQRRRATVPPANNSVRRTYDLVRATLANLPPGTVLVESQLVETLSASRNTVRVVLQLLAAEGLVCRGPKVGTHVGSSVIIRLDELGPIQTLTGCQAMYKRLLETSVIVAPRVVAERLELPEGSYVRVTEGLVMDGATPVALAVSYVGLTDDDQITASDPLPDAISLLEEQMHIPVSRADTNVVALVCDGQTSKLLHVPEGAPILFVEDLLRDADGRPRALSQFRFRSDGVMFSVTAWRTRGFVSSEVPVAAGA